MIHVSISLEYKGIPFTIELDSQNPLNFDLEGLGVLLVRIKAFIGKMLEEKAKQ